MKVDYRKKDYYKILGVSFGAGGEEIKKARAKRLFEYHPDRNPEKAGAEEKTVLINEAYKVLSNAEKRTEYNKYWKEFHNTISVEDAKKIYPPEVVRQALHKKFLRRLIEQKNIYEKMKEYSDELKEATIKILNTTGVTQEIEKEYAARVSKIYEISKKTLDSLKAIRAEAEKHAFADQAEIARIIKELNEFKIDTLQEIVQMKAYNIRMPSWEDFDELFTNAEPRKKKNYDSFYKEELRRTSAAWVAALGISSLNAAIINSVGNVYPDGRSVDILAAVALAFELNLKSEIFKSIAGGKSAAKLRAGERIRIKGLEEISGEFVVLRNRAGKITLYMAEGIKGADGKEYRAAYNSSGEWVPVAEASCMRDSVILAGIERLARRLGELERVRVNTKMWGAI
jgi:curved DNA-binding protein CbpA